MKNTNMIINIGILTNINIKMLVNKLIEIKTGIKHIFTRNRINLKNKLNSHSIAIQN